MALRHPRAWFLPVDQQGFEDDAVGSRQAVAALVHTAADAGVALETVLRKAVRDVHRADERRGAPGNGRDH